MPASAWLEACMVVDRRLAGNLAPRMDELMARLNIEIAELTPAHMRRAREAWGRYGRGIHPAGLNFGDCMVYGFARSIGEPLLFKGRDFSQTDIEPALKD